MTAYDGICHHDHDPVDTMQIQVRTSQADDRTSQLLTNANRVASTSTRTASGKAMTQLHFCSLCKAHGKHDTTHRKGPNCPYYGCSCTCYQAVTKGGVKGCKLAHPPGCTHACALLQPSCEACEPEANPHWRDFERARVQEILLREPTTSPQARVLLLR